jgi:hypothetical protein
MNDIHDMHKPVRRMNPHDAEETLGVWIAPDGNTEIQCKKLLEKAIMWADQMRTGLIRREETWLALQSTIWQTLCYPLNAMNLSMQQCNAIMSPILNYALPAMGICRNFPRALVHSSTKHMGLGIKHIHTLQEIAHLKDLIHHAYVKSTTGLLYRTSLEYLLLEVDMDVNLTAVDFPTFHMLATDSLIKSTWEFLNKHNMIDNGPFTTPSPLTQYDCFFSYINDLSVSNPWCYEYLTFLHITFL